MTINQDFHIFISVNAHSVPVLCTKEEEAEGTKDIFLWKHAFTCLREIYLYFRLYQAFARN